jgi:hypothetical protein
MYPYYMTAKKVYPPTAPTAPVPVSSPYQTTPVCEVVEMPDGTGVATVLIDAQVLARHKRRAGPMDLSRYLWESVLHRALVDSVY